MAFLALAIFAILVIVSYRLGGRDLLSPWFLLCLAIFGSYCILMLNYKNWDVLIYGKFMLYILTAIVSFGLGCLLVTKLCRKNVLNNDKERVALFSRNFKSKYPINIILFFSIVCAVLYIYKLISDAGSGGSFSDILRRIYSSSVDDGYSPGFIYNQMMEIVIAIAYISSYRLVLKMNSRNDKISFIKLIIPIILFLIVAMVSTNRNMFLQYAIYFICIFIIVYSEGYAKRDANKRILLKVIPMLAFIIIIFFLLGKAKQYSSNMFKSVSIYAGSGLYSFNIWLENFDGPLTCGASTFTTFLGTLNTVLNPLGIHFDIKVDQIDEFIYFYSSNGYLYDSNIYTAMRAYVQDFGYFGVILFPFIIGMFYHWLFLKTKNSKDGFSRVIYCMLIYSVVFFPILERLFRRWTLGLLYELFWITVLYYAIYNRRTKRAPKQIIVCKQGVKNE